MNHLNRLFLLFFFIFSFGTLSLVSHSALAAGEYKNPQPSVVHEPRRLPHFSNIDVSGGDLDVIVTGGQSRQSVVVVGDSDVVKEVSTEVKNKTLYITNASSKNCSKAHHHKVLVKVGVTGNLSEIAVSGNARVKAHHIKSHGLSVILQDNATLVMEGNDVVLKKLENESTRNVVISGIHTKHLHVRGLGTGRIMLRGHVGIFTAYLYDTACLEARHLTAEEVYIHTEDNALGMVWPVKGLYAFAMDNSNIYYYHTPSNQLVRYSAERGNVLKVP